MTDVLTATIAVARALTVGGSVFVLGGPAPERPGWRAIDTAGAEDRIRADATSGSCLIVAGDGGDLAARDRVLRRAPAWGVTAVWVGRADRPQAGLASCIDADDAGRAIASLATAAELFEGDAEALAPPEVVCTDEICITCSDEGRLGEVVLPPVGVFLPAIVRTAAGEEEVDVTLVGDVVPGDLVLIHAGGAIARVPDLSPPDLSPEVAA